MRRIITALLLACVLSIAGSAGSVALVYGVTHPDTDPGWSVTYTSDGAMDSNFTSDSLAETISGMQPGDDAVFNISVTNASGDPTDWYMENEILYSMEDRSANSGTTGGAYTYKLTYKDSAGEETVFFDSDTVGGEDTEAGTGLHKAQSGFDGWFYLGKLDAGKSGTVTLKVVLDGETQGNNYQDTLADLGLRFAVGPADRPEDTIKHVPGGSDSDAVGTGDDSDLSLYAIICFIAGAMLLILALISFLLRRKEAREKEVS